MIRMRAPYYAYWFSRSARSCTRMNGAWYWHLVLNFYMKDLLPYTKKKNNAQRITLFDHAISCSRANFFAALIARDHDRARSHYRTVFFLVRIRGSFFFFGRVVIKLPCLCVNQYGADQFTILSSLNSNIHMYTNITILYIACARCSYSRTLAFFFSFFVFFCQSMQTHMKCQKFITNCTLQQWLWLVAWLISSAEHRSRSLSSYLTFFMLQLNTGWCELACSNTLHVYSAPEARWIPTDPKPGWILVPEWWWIHAEPTAVEDGLPGLFSRENLICMYRSAQLQQRSWSACENRANCPNLYSPKSMDQDEWNAQHCDEQNGHNGGERGPHRRQLSHWKSFPDFGRAIPICLWTILNRPSLVRSWQETPRCKAENVVFPVRSPAWLYLSLWQR